MLREVPTDADHMPYQFVLIEAIRKLSACPVDGPLTMPRQGDPEVK